MAYIHKQTFDIMNFSNADDYLGDCFDCDDMIAPIIQMLNRKGYVTTFSCSGHPYEDVLEYLSEDEVDLDKFPIGGTFALDKINRQIEDGDESFTANYRVLFRTLPCINAYISFENGVVLPSLPEGFEYDDEDNAIRKNDFTSESPFDFYREQLDYMKRLYDWACELPILESVAV